MAYFPCHATSSDFLEKKSLRNVCVCVCVCVYVRACVTFLTK